MKILFVWSLAILGSGWNAMTWADTQVQARVNADRVNLRARPELQSETVSQVSIDTLLGVSSVTNGWVEVIPPASVDFWVHREFVVEDKVVVKKLNARSGAGINYHVVGSFSRGDTVQRRGSFGEWLKVGPPPDARLWVSSELVDVLRPAVPVPPPVAAPASALVPEPVSSAADYMLPDAPPVAFDDSTAAMSRPATPPPSDLRLIPLDGQGRVVQREGLLKRSPTLFLKAPGAYRLVKRDGNRLITTAYVRGNTAQLNALLEQHLLVQGREYWVESVKVPVIVIEAIEKRAFY